MALQCSYTFKPCPMVHLFYVSAPVKFPVTFIPEGSSFGNPVNMEFNYDLKKNNIKQEKKRI